mgnify:CR=1 FL=1
MLTSDYEKLRAELEAILVAEDYVRQAVADGDEYLTHVNKKALETAFMALSEREQVIVNKLITENTFVCEAVLPPDDNKTTNTEWMLMSGMSLRHLRQEYISGYTVIRWHWKVLHRVKGQKNAYYILEWLDMPYEDGQDES